MFVSFVKYSSVINLIYWKQLVSLYYQQNKRKNSKTFRKKIYSAFYKLCHLRPL